MGVDFRKGGSVHLTPNSGTSHTIGILQLLEAASRLRFTANRFAPINQLPPELLCEVFFYLRPVVEEEPRRPWSTELPFEDLLAVTHTCQRWRETAIVARKLWSQLNVRNSSESLDGLTRLFIRRSGLLPLDATVDRQLVAITPYIPRLRILSCTVSTQDLSTLREHPAPLLETLHILSYHHPLLTTPLPALFKGETPSLRKLYVNGFDPFPNNDFRGLSSLRLRLSSGGGDPAFWVQLLAVLRHSPWLEEIFLYLGPDYNNFPSPEGISTPVALRALQRLHIQGLASTLVRRFLKSISLPPSGTAMQFTDTSHSNWTSLPTLPLDLSSQAVTSLEIIYYHETGLAIQGTNSKTQIRIAETTDSNAMRAEIFPQLTPRTDQHPLRELWIHVGRRTNFILLPLSKFPQLRKIVVRAAPGGNLICRVLRQLETTDGYVPCPLLSTLDLSGVVDVGLLTEVLKTRLRAGHKLRRLRVGKTRGLREEIGRVRVRDFVDRLKIFDVDAEPRGMQLPVVCTTDLGEWWRPWTPEGVTPVGGRAHRT